MENVCGQLVNMRIQSVFILDYLKLIFGFSKHSTNSCMRQM